MNKNLIIFATVILVLLILGGGYLLLGGKTNQPVNNVSDQNTQENTQAVTPTVGAEASEEVETTTIEYTDEGFNPSSVTIKSGDSVTWTNNSSSQMWVASSPHPVHTDYPGFDALKGMQEGESYTFTFTKTGAWKYHNHLNPSMFGEVVVE